ncbi:MAG: glutamate formimidoyltransferase [Iamia sp.]
MLECVVNVSEGRDPATLDALAGAAGPDLLDIHSDPDHHRSVWTLRGEAAPRRLTRVAVERLDLGDHAGVHPCIGVVDVVPFVALDPTPASEARAARDRFARWAADELALPSFAYGPERTLPDVRRQAFDGLAPTAGPDRPHPTAGAVAVGAREVLVAYNLWLAGAELDLARQVARDLRGPAVRAMGLAVGHEVQVSLNLVRPSEVGPGAAWDAVATRVEVARAELVGLVPEAVLRAEPEARWAQLDLSPDRTIEARTAALG